MSKKLDQSSKDLEMSVEQQVPTMMFAAVPPTPFDNRKSWLARAARAMGWSPRRTKALFYREARVITADEWKTLNQRLDALKNAERRHGEETNELRTAYRMAGQGMPLAGRISDPMQLGAAPSVGARRREIDEA